MTNQEARTELIRIAADVARRRYLPSLENCRTIKQAREVVAMYDQHHMTLMERIRRVIDGLEVRTATTKLERPCAYCGTLTPNFFAACCDKPECREQRRLDNLFDPRKGND